MSVAEIEKLLKDYREWLKDKTTIGRWPRNSPGIDSCAGSRLNATPDTTTPSPASTRGAVSPGEIFSTSAAAWVSRLRGANNETTDLYDRAVSDDRSALEPDKLSLASHLLAQADFLMSLHDFAAARPLAREALEIRTQQLPDGFWSIDLARLVVAETGRAETGRDEAATRTSLANVQRKLGDNALLSRAAAERVAHKHPALPLF